MICVIFIKLSPVLGLNLSKYCYYLLITMILILTGEIIATNNSDVSLIKYTNKLYNADNLDIYSLTIFLLMLNNTIMCVLKFMLCILKSMRK
jgi:hypothetical protein